MDKFDHLLLDGSCNEPMKVVKVIRRLVQEIYKAQSLEEAKAYAKVMGFFFEVECEKEIEFTLQDIEHSNKIQIIKAIRNAFGYGLRESKGMTEDLPKKIGKLSGKKAEEFKKDIESHGGRL